MATIEWEVIYTSRRDLGFDELRNIRLIRSKILGGWLVAFFGNQYYKLTNRSSSNVWLRWVDFRSRSRPQMGRHFSPIRSRYFFFFLAFSLSSMTLFGTDSRCFVIRVKFSNASSPSTYSTTLGLPRRAFLSSDTRRTPALSGCDLWFTPLCLQALYASPHKCSDNGRYSNNHRSAHYHSCDGSKTRPNCGTNG